MDGGYENVKTMVTVSCGNKGLWRRYRLLKLKKLREMCRASIDSDDAIDDVVGKFSRFVSACTLSRCYHRPTRERLPPRRIHCNEIKIETIVY
jgi:hypothetical protein